MTFEEPTLEEAIEWVNWYFHLHYKKTLDDMVISGVRGYWRAKVPCHGECRMGHYRPLCHTYSFAQHGDRGKNGRFLRPFRAWEVIKKNTVVTP